MAQELPERTVTVLFTDVVGSTDLTTRRGDEAAQEILRAQRNLVRQLAEGKGFPFGDRGEVALRGFDDPVRVYEVRRRGV